MQQWQGILFATGDNMPCQIPGCSKETRTSSATLCEMHYYRLRRTGSTDMSPREKKYRISRADGYQLLFLPDHKLASSNGYAYEHRVVYNSTHGDPESCALCGKEISWGTCHIDHIDNDRTHNTPSNLRATCQPCNTWRGMTQESMGSIITIGDIGMTAAAWARQPGVLVTGSTIRRRVSSGMTPHEAVFGCRKTHKNTVTTKKPVIRETA